MDAGIPSMDGLFTSRVTTACGAPGDVQGALHPAEMKSIARAVDERRQEFVAGRTLARQALKQLGLTDMAVPVGSNREPVWPAGTTGSISHTQGFCGVAVARLADVRGLGFDVEDITRMRTGLSSEMVSDEELLGLRQVTAGDIERALALAFSAKESFYKFQYPLSGQWVGLLDVHLTADETGFQIAPFADIPHVCAGGKTIRGTYCFRGEYVMTGIEAAVPHRLERKGVYRTRESL